LIVVTGLMFFLLNQIFSQGYSTTDTLEFPIRGAFYYSWYPQTWTVGGAHVFYQPELGYYNSDNEEVVAQHIEDMEYAKIDVVIASWWRIESHNQAYRFPLMLNKTSEMGAKLKWAVYYETEGSSNPTIEELRSNLDYIKTNYTGHEAYAHINGKPVIFVYNANDKSCEVADRWIQATNGEWYVNLKVFGGFRDCTNQPDSWHQYGPATRVQHHKGYSYVISPGFWRADESTPRLVRDPDMFYQNVREMVASGEPWQLVTTYNEWGEGTAIERCYDWQSDTEYGKYLDALHFDGIIQTSIKDHNNENDINMFYDPEYDHLVISNAMGIQMAEIFSVTGSLLKMLKINNQETIEIALHSFPAGIYLIKLNLGSGGIRLNKFIKQ
jgi:hypothetical protein